MSKLGLKCINSGITSTAGETYPVVGIRSYTSNKIDDINEFYANRVYYGSFRIKNHVSYNPYAFIGAKFELVIL